MRNFIKQQGLHPAQALNKERLSFRPLERGGFPGDLRDD
jgi:hypothetical protein